MKVLLYILCLFLISGCSKISQSEKEVCNNNTLFNIKGDSIEYKDKENKTILVLPKVQINKYTVSSTTHLAFINELAKYDTCVFSKLSGATSDAIKYSSNEAFIKKFNQGQIKNIGNDDNLDFEYLSGISAHFSVPFYFNNEINTIGKTKCKNYPIYEWMENTPLNRASWIKVFANLLSTKGIGDSIYNKIEQRYTKEIVSNNSSNKIKIIVGEPYQGIWYASLPNSYIGTLIKDAGAELIFKPSNNPNDVNTPIDIEEAIFLFKDADIWINVSQNSIKDLIRTSPWCQNFKSVKNGMVFNNMKRVTNEIKNDYWESAVVNPDIILKDIKYSIKNQTDSLYYFKKLY